MACPAGVTKNSSKRGRNPRSRPSTSNKYSTSSPDDDPSALGAVAFETGGILIDHGWLRLLGSGHERMHENLLSWNTKGQITAYRLLHGAWIIAHGVIGGFFALNGGAFSGELGTVYYFEPHILKWRGLGGTYSQLIAWALSGDLEQFYRDTRWPNWEN